MPQPASKRKMLLEDMTRDEISLLLYMESCAVDREGKLNSQRMNQLDMDNAEYWTKIGFVKFGRICSEDITKSSSGDTHWCRLSDEAFKLATEARKVRMERGWENRKWQTVEEFRGGV